VAIDEYHAERMAEYEERLARFSQRYTFGEAAMRFALDEARRAAEEGEVPVGAIVVIENRIVAAAHNLPLGLHDPTAHAEILAIREAATAIQEYRLTEASLYVTLEPCVMCVGAIVNARIAKVYFGARDAKAGAFGSVYDIGRDGRLNHRVEVYGGILAEECGRMLRDFFTPRRAGKTPARP
jgi:tRNA(Arg) A34 adenosine deaminase TadA